MADPTEAEKITILETQLAEAKQALVDATAAEELAAVAVTAANKAYEKKIKEQAAVIAAHELNKASSVPLEKLPEMIQAGIKENDEIKAREAAYIKFAAARTERKLETKPEDYTTLKAADFERSVKDLETLRPIAAGGAQYSAGASGSAPKINIYDPITKGWI